MSLSEQEEQRRKSREEIIDLGIDPYPSETFDINTNSQEIKDDFDEKKKNFQDVSISGRIMSRRVMGSASFAEIQDSKGKIQIYVRRDDICEGDDKTLYNTIFKKKLDLGDIIGRFKKVIVPELNLGQLSLILRAKYLVDAIPLTKVQGKPFKVSELRTAFHKELS